MCPCAMRVTYAWMFEGKTMYREVVFAEISPANMERREDK